MGKDKEHCWSRWDNFSFDCCKDCVPPKRYPGCGDHCKEYKEKKREYEARKEKIKENKGRVYGKHDFDMLQPKSEGRKRKT